MKRVFWQRQHQGMGQTQSLNKQLRLCVKSLAGNGNHTPSQHPENTSKF